MRTAIAFVLGFALGSAAAATAATCIGTGYLGALWTVEVELESGDELECDSLYVWPSLHTIEASSCSD